MNTTPGNADFVRDFFQVSLAVEGRRRFRRNLLALKIGIVAALSVVLTGLF